MDRKFSLKKLTPYALAVAYATIICLCLLGVCISGGDKMMYNVLIMPVAGAIGYLVFKWKAVYILPVVLAAVSLFACLAGLSELDAYSVFIWWIIYAALALVGVAIVFLFHFGGSKREGILRIFRVVALALAIVLTVGGCFVVNGLVGNPLSVMLVKKNAQEYIEANYPDTDYVVDNVGFSFKDGSYYASVSSQSSADSYFSLDFRMDGRLTYDSFEDSVVKRRNTARRLEDEYRRRVEDVLSSSAFPYESDIGYGELVIVGRDDLAQNDSTEHLLIAEELVLDGFYDVSELGARAGHLTIYICDDQVSAQRLATVLLELKSIFDRSGVRFNKINCVLEHPRTEDGGRKEGRVEVMDFDNADIYAEGLEERVAASDKAANEYYAEQDAKK